MTVAELIKKLKKMPAEAQVETIYTPTGETKPLIFQPILSVNPKTLQPVVIVY